MKKISVLVTGIGGGGHGEQIIKSLKLIKDLKIKIIGTDIIPFTSGKNIVDKFYQVPLTTSKMYEKKIFQIINRNRVKFIFHGSEPELKFISKNRKKFEAIGVCHPLNSRQVIDLCSNKYKTYLKLEQLGVKLPKFKKINSLKDIESINFYPIVLKPNTSSGGSANVNIALDKFECNLFVKYMLRHNIDIIAQQYVGSHLKEYTIGISSDKYGKILGSIILKREMTNALTINKKVIKNNKTYIVSSGISQGQICLNINLKKQAEKIALSLKSKGPLNIQCREVNGKLMLFEINPRLSGSTSLRAIAGYNEPYLLIRNKIFGYKWKKDYKEMIIMRTINEIKIK